MRYFTIPLVLLIDQISKWWIVNILMKPLKLIYVTSFFDLTLTYNYGVSFGMFSNQRWSKFVFILIALNIIGFLFYWLRKAETKLLIFSIGMIIGGGLSNVVDRLFRGAVVDFLSFHLGRLYWPAFNFADSFIVIGVMIILTLSLRHPKNLLK